MLDDGRMLFLSNYVYTYSFYGRTMMIFYWSALTVRLNFKPKVGSYESGAGPRCVWKMSAVSLTRLQ